MAYDEGLAHQMREDLAEETGITEKKMFGGLCFLLNGNMLCGVHRDGAMFRTGKDREAEALAVTGTSPMMLTGRRMGGIIDADADLMADDTRRTRLMDLALAHARALPEK